MKDVLLASAMVAGVVARAFAQPATTDQAGDHGMQTKAYIESRCFVPAVSAMRLVPAYNGQLREGGA